MERKQTRMTRKTYYARKIKEAVHLLFYQHHRKPGVKGWELKKRLGSNYPTVLNVLDDYLEKLDLQVKTIFEAEETIEKPTLKQLDTARFYITLRGEIDSEEAKLIGWRIDDIAGLAIAISFIISKGGIVPRKDVEELLQNKIPDWRVDMNLRRYIQSGYLGEDENEQLYLDWRTRAEIDQKELVELLLTADFPLPESD